ncbi:hypothetical protein [Amycolatopsis sp. lyj-84]|uniref:hypothetical protein n=1 Tax=Amycolatopsis sp. lyj-84 TaxID=2789284 RepID=UPI00397B6C77
MSSVPPNWLAALVSGDGPGRYAQACWSVPPCNGWSALIDLPLQLSIEGRLVGVSDIRNSVELEQVGGAVIRARVVEELVPELGRYYTRRVEATFDVTTIRSLVTGTERKNYSLVELASTQEA